MQLELDDQEAETVRSALDAHIEELRHEWARTEDHNYRHDLWQTITRLEAVVQRLPPAREKSNVSVMF